MSRGSQASGFYDLVLLMFSLCLLGMLVQCDAMHWLRAPPGCCALPVTMNCKLRETLSP